MSSNLLADSATGSQAEFNARMLKLATFVIFLTFTLQLKALRRQMRFAGISSLFTFDYP